MSNEEFVPMTKHQRSRSKSAFSSFVSAFSAFKSAFSAFFISHQSKFIIMGIIFFVLSFLGTLPYFNLLLTKATVLFIVWVLAIFLLKLSGQVSVAGALVLLGACPLLLIFKNEHLAKELADLAFGLLLVGTIQEFVKYWKEEREEIK